MKIAIPLSSSDEFSPHYGASAKFEVFDVDAPQRSVRRRMIIVPTEAEPCAWPPFLQAAGVQLILVGGMGSGAQRRMSEHGIKVLAGVPAEDPDSLVNAWLAGRLTAGANPCDGEGSGHAPPHGTPGEHEAGGCGCGY